MEEETEIKIKCPNCNSDNISKSQKPKSITGFFLVFFVNHSDTSPEFDILADRHSRFSRARSLQHACHGRNMQGSSSPENGSILFIGKPTVRSCCS